MKFSKTILAAAVAAATMITGCKSVPTPEQMKTAATAIGAAAGLVANETKIDDKARNAVVAIVNEVASVTPEQGQTFEQAWTPVAERVVAKLVKDGKLDDATGKIALTAFSVAVKGIDYIFTVRYPKAGEYAELVSAAVAGFTDGFLTTFKPANAEEMVKASAKVQPDAEALAWLRHNVKAAK